MPKNEEEDEMETFIKKMKKFVGIVAGSLSFHKRFI